LEAVRRYTLAKFREEGANHGGIDLRKLKEELKEFQKRTRDPWLLKWERE